MIKGEKKRIFVGLSGGVDSSVAALRLQRAGHEVVGVFIKVWHPDFIVCDEEKDRLDAMRVAAHLGIPFLTFDAVEAYKQGVADYMIAEYKAGRTPNPDVMCNKHVKFGAFLDFALAHGADAVATGHYARIGERNGARTLLRGVDAGKDQSYFLWTLTNEQLNHIEFPIGDTVKADIRKEAEQAGLPTARKHDSQGICFLGEIDMKDFLSHYITTEKGSVLDEDGKVIGEHDGALYYTFGQRHGFTVHEQTREQQPKYVVAKDTEKNTITVADAARKTGNDKIELLNTILRQDPQHVGLLTAQFRYRQEPFPVRIEVTPGERAIVEVLQAVDTPHSGQSCVLYDGEHCLGGGVIS